MKKMYTLRHLAAGLLASIFLAGCATTTPSPEPAEQAPKTPPPTVMLLPAAKNAHGAEIEAAANRVFGEYGFPTVDQSVIQGNREKIRGLLASSGNEQGAAEAAALYGADVVVQAETETRTLSSGIQGSNLKSYLAMVTLKAVDTDNGRILATETAESKAIALDAETGYAKAIRQATGQATEALVSPLYYAWEERVKLQGQPKASAPLSLSSAMAGQNDESEPLNLSSPPDGYKPAVAAIWSLTAQTGAQEEWMPPLTETLQALINRSGWYRVVTRNDMKQLLAEHSVQMSDVCDTTEQAVEYGKILSAEYMVIGTVSRLAGTYQVVLKLVHVETGEVKKVGQAERRGSTDVLFGLVRQAAADLLRTGGQGEKEL